MPGKRYNTCKGPEVGRHTRLECKGQRGQQNQDKVGRRTGPTMLHF